MGAGSTGGVGSSGAQGTGDGSGGTGSVGNSETRAGGIDSREEDPGSVGGAQGTGRGAEAEVAGVIDKAGTSTAGSDGLGAAAVGMAGNILRAKSCRSGGIGGSGSGREQTGIFGRAQGTGCDSAVSGRVQGTGGCCSAEDFSGAQADRWPAAFGKGWARGTGSGTGGKHSARVGNGPVRAGGNRAWACSGKGLATGGDCGRHGARVGNRSAAFSREWAQAMGMGGSDRATGSSRDGSAGA